MRDVLPNKECSYISHMHCRRKNAGVTWVIWICFKSWKCVIFCLSGNEARTPSVCEHFVTFIWPVRVIISQKRSTDHVNKLFDIFSIPFYSVCRLGKQYWGQLDHCLSSHSGHTDEAWWGTWGDLDYSSNKMQCPGIESPQNDEAMYPSL